jgi:hypothetical protein
MLCTARKLHRLSSADVAVGSAEMLAEGVASHIDEKALSFEVWRSQPNRTE